MFNESNPEPSVHPENPGHSTWVRFDFQREEGGDTVKWSEEFDLIDLLGDVLAEDNTVASRQGNWLVTDRGFWLKPQFVEHSFSDDAIRTTTTIEVAHPSLLSRACFEYQHSRSEDSAKDSIRSGFVQWARMDWKVFEDLAGPDLQHCQSMSMSFPTSSEDGSSSSERSILFGPATHMVAKQASESLVDEHPFCPCCLFTNTMEAFIPQLHSTGTFGLRLYAARGADGEVMADCRVNGEDCTAGMNALRTYVESWPDLGFEFRKQYVIVA